MKHEPCSACGYIIQHDEECPSCGREYLDEQITELQTKLAAAQAEIEELRKQLSYASVLLAEEGMSDAAWQEYMTHCKLQTQLATTQAEIERLKRFFEDMREDRDRRITAHYVTIDQLTNLRAAAERFLLTRGNAESRRVLRAAIEASK